MGAFDISYNDIAGAPLGSGRKKVAPIQAAQGIAAPTAALSSPQLIDARQSITQAPTVQQLVPAQSITQGAESYMRAHQPGDAVAISYPPIMPDATTTPSPVPAMPTPPGIARSMAGAPVQQPAPATLADIRQPNNQAQPMRNQPVMNPVEPPAAAPAPAQTVDDGAGGVYTPGGGAIGPDKQGGGIVSGIANFFRDSAQAARTGVHYDDVKAGRLAADSAGTSNASSGATPNTIADATPAAGQQSYRPGSAMANALNETDNFPQSRPGDPIAPPQTPQKPGRNSDGVITAETAKDAYGADMQRSGGVFGTMDMKGVNDIMARENQARGEMIDSMIKANGGNGIAVMPDSQGRADAEWNAKVDSRGAISDLQSSLRRAGTRTERAAIGQALNTMLAGQNQLATESLRGENQQIAEQGRNAVAMRGQNINAQNEANRLAIDAPYRTEQAAGLREQNRSAAVIADLQNKALAGDARAIETLRALNGKTNQATDRFMAVQGGEEIGPDGMTKIKRPGGVFDAQTGRFVEMSPQQGGPGKFSKADVDSALAKGADKTKIAERIKSMGGNPADYGL